MTLTSLRALTHLTATDLGDATAAALADDPDRAIRVLRGSRARRATYAGAVGAARQRLARGRTGLREAAAELQLLARVEEIGEHADTLARQVAMGLLHVPAARSLEPDLAVLGGAGRHRVAALSELGGPEWGRPAQHEGVELLRCRDHLAAYCADCGPDRPTHLTAQVCHDLAEAILTASRYAGRVA